MSADLQSFLAARWFDPSDSPSTVDARVATGVSATSKSAIADVVDVCTSEFDDSETPVATRVIL